MTSEQWQDLRAHLMATGRSQQMPLVELQIVLQLVDEAAASNWQPPVADAEVEFKLP